MGKPVVIDLHCPACTRDHRVQITPRKRGGVRVRALDERLLATPAIAASWPSRCSLAVVFDNMVRRTIFDRQGRSCSTPVETVLSDLRLRRQGRPAVGWQSTDGRNASRWAAVIDARVRRAFTGQIDPAGCITGRNQHDEATATLSYRYTHDRSLTITLDVNVFEWQLLRRAGLDVKPHEFLCGLYGTLGDGQVRGYFWNAARHAVQEVTYEVKQGLLRNRHVGKQLPLSLSSIALSIG